jgi:hypothetical protein
LIINTLLVFLLNNANYTGSKAPEGRDIGNKSRPLSIYSPRGVQYWLQITSNSGITPLWGYKGFLAVVCYRYYAPLVRFEPVIRINTTYFILKNNNHQL